jgi:hypothetical protein
MVTAIVCNNSDSKNQDQGTPERVKTSLQKGAGLEVVITCGTDRPSNMSVRLRRKTR